MLIVVAGREVFAISSIKEALCATPGATFILYVRPIDTYTWSIDLYIKYDPKSLEYCTTRTSTYTTTNDTPIHRYTDTRMVCSVIGRKRQYSRGRGRLVPAAGIQYQKMHLQPIIKKGCLFDAKPVQTQF